MLPLPWLWKRSWSIRCPRAAEGGAVVTTSDGTKHAVSVVEFSQTELVLDMKGLAAGESVVIEMTGNGHTDTFKATVAREAKGFTGI